jgi:hypothetical protein
VKRSLAVLAVLFLLLRPMCDALAAGQAYAASAPAAGVQASQEVCGGGAHDDAPCCASVAEHSLVQPSISGAGRDWASAEVLPVAPGWFVRNGPRDTSQAGGEPPGTSFITLSYYVRSARIQR